MVEKRGGLLQAIGFNAPGRQFNRERHTVKNVKGRWLFATAAAS